MRRFTAVFTGGIVVVAGLAAVGPVAPASAGTVSACVKKKTGEMRMLTGTKKRKCAKGWKKVTWNQEGPQGSTGSPGSTGPQGPQGSTGATGPKLVVKDGTGATLGSLVSIFPGDAAFFVLVLVGDRIYSYQPNGRVAAMGSPVFLDSSCASTPYVTAANADEEAGLVALAGTQFRLTFRPTAPTPGNISTYSFTNVTLTPPGTIYEWNASGACVLDTSAPSALVKLQTEATGPSDKPGPLTLAEG